MRTDVADERPAGVAPGRLRPPLPARVAASIAVACGLAAMVAGTFLPWLRSGASSRNSFRAAGLIDRLLHPPGLAGVFLTIWPGVVLACAVAISGLALGLHRAAVLLAAPLAVVVGGVAATTLLLPARSYASVDAAGPAVCLAGAVLVLTGAVVVGAAVSLDRRRRRRSRPAAC